MALMNLSPNSQASIAFVIHGASPLPATCGQNVWVDNFDFLPEANYGIDSDEYSALIPLLTHLRFPDRPSRHAESQTSLPSASRPQPQRRRQAPAASSP